MSPIASPQHRDSWSCRSRHVIAVALAAAWALAGALVPTGSRAAAPAAEVGQPAPDVELPAASIARRLSDLRGKVVYLDFWASWCGPCQQSFPWMKEMQAKYASRGLLVVAINLDAKRSDADEFLARNPANFALAFDSQGESARRIGVKGMPTSLLVGADGKVLYVHQGFRLDQREALEARLVAALAGASTAAGAARAP